MCIRDELKVPRGGCFDSNKVWLLHSSIMKSCLSNGIVPRVKLFQCAIFCPHRTCQIRMTNENVISGRNYVKFKTMTAPCEVKNVNLKKKKRPYGLVHIFKLLHWARFCANWSVVFRVIPKTDMWELKLKLGGWEVTFFLPNHLMSIFFFIYLFIHTLAYNLKMDIDKKKKMRRRRKFWQFISGYFTYLQSFSMEYMYFDIRKFVILGSQNIVWAQKYSII